jgi:hypothetical protein
LKAEGVEFVTMHDYYGQVLAQTAEDPDWITDASRDGLILLLKDKECRYQPLERAALCRGKARAFALANGNLTGPQMAEAYGRHIARIIEIAERQEGPFFYHVHLDRGPVRMDLFCEDVMP